MNTCHTSFSYRLWAYGEHVSKWSSWTSDQFIWLVLEKKTEAVKAYLIKNSKGEGGEGKKEKKTAGGGWSEGSRKELAELYGCIKQVSNDQSLQWQSLENLSLSLSVWERQRTGKEREREGGRERERERGRERETKGERERERERGGEICTDLFPWLLIPFFFISSIFAWWLLTFVFCLLQHIVNSKLVWWWSNAQVPDIMTYWSGISFIVLQHLSG